MEKSVSKKNNVIKNVCVGAGCFALCTALCFLLDYFKVNDLNFLIIYVLGILLTAVFTDGMIYSAGLSVLSILGHNIFFTLPRYSLKINDPRYILTFALMLAVGIGIGLITCQLKKRLGQISDLKVERVTLKNEAEKEQVKATLLRSISHDLRTPLTIIKNGSELLCSNPDISAEDRREILSDITAKSEWTIRMVENLLTLSRIDGNNLKVKKTPEAAEEVIPQAVRTVKGKLGGRKIHCELPEELMLVPMDGTLIVQVLSNLLTNAVKYTSDDGNIWIQAFATGRHAVFRVSNDGEPLKEEELPRLFEMYYTDGDGAREGGVGLGLAICELIVRAHGGTIEARNSEHRTVFEFILPAED